MTKQVTVEELRSGLESILDEVQDGTLIEVVRDGKTVATIKPVLQVVQRGTPYPFRDLDISPLDKPLPFDVVDWLIEERESERSGKKYGL